LFKETAGAFNGVYTHTDFDSDLLTIGSLRPILWQTSKRNMVKNSLLVKWVKK